MNLERKLRVGNLESRRAITDVRDVIQAFDLALEKASFGEAYNLSGAKVYQTREIVEIIRALVGFDFAIEQDPTLLRPTDEPIIFGSSEKFQEQTDWKQEIPLEETLRDMLSYWDEVLQVA
jgi:GDP-4-dehydro-6-deoxy-D-mannose reductase